MALSNPERQAQPHSMVMCLILPGIEFKRIVYSLWDMMPFAHGEMHVY